MQGKLNVAAALDFELPYDLYGRVIELFKIVIVQGQYGGDHYGVSGMDAYRIDVLHAADSDGPVSAVTHHLKFNFLESLHGFLDQDLMYRGKIERPDPYIFQLFFIAGEASSGAAESKRRSEHDRIADLFCCQLCFLNAVGDHARYHRLAYGLAHLFEELSVLGSLDGVCGSSEKLYSALGKNSLAVELHRKVESRLSADPRNDGVRPLISEYLRDIFKRERLHIYLVRNRCVGHDRRRVGVAEDHLVSLLLQRETGLCARVIELRSLADNDRAASYDKYLFDVFSFCHFALSPACPAHTRIRKYRHQSVLRLKLYRTEILRAMEIRRFQINRRPRKVVSVCSLVPAFIEIGFQLPFKLIFRIEQPDEFQRDPVKHFPAI